jgi:hypothetical protein
MRMQIAILIPSQPTLSEQASNLVLPSIRIFSRRELLLSGVAALLGSGLNQSAAAQEVTFESHELIKIDIFAKQLTESSLRGMGFESSYQLTEWARKKLSYFQSGDLKIEGCSTLKQAGDFLYKALSNAADGFNALGEIHYARSLKAIGDNEWNGLISDSAISLRNLTSELRTSKNYPSELPSQIKTASQPLLDRAAQYQESTKVELCLIAASALALGALAAWNCLRENKIDPKSARQRVHDEPGLL